MLGPTIGYIDLLDQATSEKLRNEALLPKKSSPLRPSSAGACTRSLAYGLMEYHQKDNYHCEPFGPSVHRLLALGSAIEVHLIQELESCGFKALNKQHLLRFGKIESAFDLSMSQEIQGSIDFLLIHNENQCVADVKSVGGNKYIWNAKSKAYLAMKSVQVLSPQSFWIEDLQAFIEEAKDPFLTSNLAQLNYYAHSEFIQSLGMDHAVILQYSKSDSQLREFRFKPSHDLFIQTSKKFQVALDAAAQGSPELARRDHEKDSVACRYCRYEHVCKTVSEDASSELKKGAENGI